MTNFNRFLSFFLSLVLSPALLWAAPQRGRASTPKISGVVVRQDQLVQSQTLSGKAITCLMQGTKGTPGQVRTQKGKILFIAASKTISSQISRLRQSPTKKNRVKILSLKNDLSEQVRACRFDAALEPPVDDSLTVEKAHHLYRRAGFGATKTDIDLAVQTGLQATIQRLFSFTATTDLDGESSNLLDGDPEPDDPGSVRAEGVRLAFLNNMLKSPNQLREKMSLFFHDLLAASHRVVPGNDGHMVLDYYSILRNNSLGNFRTLCQQITTNGMMLYWLDGRVNRAGKTNENYAREFWERFTLGQGNYTERDISESARALTGWTTKWDNDQKRDEVTFVPANLDPGSKIIFEGTPWEISGNFNTADLINITLDRHPEAPRHLAKALYRFFVHLDPPETTLVALSKELKDGNYEIAPLVRKILLSKDFFSPQAMRSGVKTPVEFSLGLIRNTGLPIFDIRYLERSIRDMGMQVLNPPSVKGWDDNEYWLNDQWMTTRASLVHKLLNEASPEQEDFTLRYLLPTPTANADQFLDQVLLYLGIGLNPEKRANILRYLNYIRNWKDEDEPWLFDPRHEENFETKARGILFILAQDDSYQMD